ncbi:ABC transporter substrate-binding protein [Sneathiella chungangensis]|uniref:ABC transporter substrate-binding protein n=1 Tax=Sneathiella chungangensis TaxID=1418234 RepID=A0A845MJP1_9PROT|nr:extracellular solute-binding protein [Sneathiella chungangensis]MZR23640.1 ABC transporter substrate-binding protein [Sneathiella chungangensis]
MGFLRSAVTAILLLSLPLPVAAEEVKTTKSHGLSLAGPLKYGPDFTHLDYVNPNAPKGGDVKLSAVGGFDNLNPFISRGQSANGLGLTFETLLTQSYDDPSAEYGLVAESIEVAEDLSFAIFNLRPEARFHDGTPITADDLIFSLAEVKEKGTPLFRYYYADVESAEKLGDHRIKFNFSGPPNRELPQIVGQLLPVLSKKHFEGRSFDETTLTPILGSGPYRVKSFEPNRYITYERVDDYWGADLPVNKGRYNFGTIRYDFYRDTAVLLEAFKAGEYDYRAENSAKNWATGYDFPAVKAGLVILEEVPNERSAGMQGYAFNLRRAKFQDPALREALTYAFDFEWLNRNIFYDQYSRTNSFFENSVMAATGEPTKEELAILEPYRDQLPPRVFGPAYKAPVTDGSGQDRAPLRVARKILEDAGWEVKNGKLIDPNTGKPLTIEFLMYDPNSLRITGPFIKNLKKLGIDASTRVVDTAQYTERLRNYDFDITTAGFGQSISPGNEQREFWGSEAGKRPGSRNVMGIDNPVVDALIENLISAPTYEDLIPAVRALDRVLTWNFYVVPQFHAAYDRIAYWNKFGHTDVNPGQGPDILAWWVDPEKEKRLQEGMKKLRQQQ